MDFAPIYLLQRFFYRFIDFFHHWYVDGSRLLGHRYVLALAAIDRVVALRITVRYFFQPLYGDYTIIGRVLGIIFRTFRILIGAAIYLCFGLLFGIIYLIWVAVPAVIILNIFNAAKYL